MPSLHAEALQFINNRDWDAAHQLVQSQHDPLSCLIHAHLHKIEGDLGNAAYWYQRAGKDLSGLSLEEEFSQLKALAESG